MTKINLFSLKKLSFSRRKKHYVSIKFERSSFRFRLIVGTGLTGSIDPVSPESTTTRWTPIVFELWAKKTVFKNRQILNSKPIQDCRTVRTKFSLLITSVLAEEIDFENHFCNFLTSVTLTLPRIGSYGIWSCITHRPLPEHQVLFKLEKHFVMYIRTDGHWDRLVRSSQRSRPSRPKNCVFDCEMHLMCIMGRESFWFGFWCKLIHFSPAQYLWTLDICRCWPNCLELFARGHAGSRGFWGQLQAVTEDIFICAVLVCSAH